MLCLLDAFEDAVYEAAVARAVRVLDRSLPGNVYSHRLLAGSHPEQRLEWFPAAYQRFQRAIWSAYLGGFTVMGRTDIKRFYDEVELDVLIAFLHRAGVPESTVREVALIYGCTARVHQGLPQGPRASDLLANALLVSVDAAVLRAFSGAYFRWADDFRLLDISPSAVRTTLGEIREALEALRLRANPNKTEVIEDIDPDTLRKNALLVSFAERIRLGDWIVAQEIQEFLRELAGSKGSPRDLRNALRLLRRCREGYAVPILLDERQPLAPFAAEAAPYLLEVGIPRRLFDDLIHKATLPRNDPEELGRLALLRCVSHFKMGGRAESDALLALVGDDSLPTLNRCWAARAAGTLASKKSVGQLRDWVADERRLPDAVARAVLVGYIAGGGNLNEAFSNHIRTRRPRLRGAIDYLEQSEGLPTVYSP